MTLHVWVKSSKSVVHLSKAIIAFGCYKLEHVSRQKNKRFKNIVGYNVWVILQLEIP